MEDIFSGVIVYVIGYSGVGKRTIAKEIVKLTAIKLIDRTVVHDLIFKITNKKDGLSKKSIRHITSIREILLDVILDCARMEQSFIITDELYQGNFEHKNTYHKVKYIAEKRGSVFIPVRLLCETDVIVKRFTSKDRSNEFKNTVPETAIENINKNAILTFSHPNLIQIDTTDLTPRDSAKLIVAKMEKILS